MNGTFVIETGHQELSSQRQSGLEVYLPVDSSFTLRKIELFSQSIILQLHER